MKKYCINLLLTSVLTACLNACSAVNSMAPFDDKQAAIVAKSMAPPSASTHH